MNELNIDIASLFSVFTRAWSLHSSSKWTKENPAKGQCGVTSLVIHDLFGGDIVKTPAAEGWHFYNRINDEYYDLTASQFYKPITYQHIPSSRSEAFQDTNPQQYTYLKQQVEKIFHIDKVKILNHALIIQGDTVLLRQPIDRDVDDYLQIETHPELVRMYGGTPSDIQPKTRERALKFVEAIRKNKLEWCVEYNGRFVGQARLVINEHDNRARYAISLFDPSVKLFR
ncbi:hypothetical protein BC359_11055 [Priestia flexa]|nr:hypothetical protein BC359_11055 [Priestia flexa]